MRRLNGSAVSTLLRSLGSPEAVYRHVATAATKFATVARLEAVRCEPGYAEIVATPSDGAVIAHDLCEWSIGLLSQPAALFGLPPATVVHDECAAYGAPACRYHLTWQAAPAPVTGEPLRELEALRAQLEAMRERLNGMFETAADLIASGDVQAVLARIADRAGTEVRAPRYLLAVRMSEGDPPHIHQRGFSPSDAEECARRVLATPAAELPASWLVAQVGSDRNRYGCLVAAYGEGTAFFPQERQYLEVYARYAAAALDSATALTEAEKRYAQSSALLQLARALAKAGTSAEIARRLAEAVPPVVDCDQVGVYLWDDRRAGLVRQAVARVVGGRATVGDDRSRESDAFADALERLLRDRTPAPLFIDTTSGDSILRSIAVRSGLNATIVLPLLASDQLLGGLSVSVRDRPARLRLTPDLLDRLTGVAAHAATALQNGRTLDQMTHDAMHDQMTGLANRLRLTAGLRTAVDRARDNGFLAALLYIDLDRFKLVNDELGHEAGDELLVAVSDRLRRSTRAGDLVARLGGDEFAVVIVAHSEAVIDNVAARIAAGFLEPFAIGGSTIQVGASVGRAVYPTDVGDAESLLRRADEAMFARKRDRRGRLMLIDGRATA